MRLSTLRLAYAGIIVLGLAGLATGQDLPPKEPEAPKEPGPQIAGKVFVRKFSAGGIFSVTTPAMWSRTTYQTPATEVYLVSHTDANLNLFGGGIATQVTITKRFAIAADLLLRKTNYQTTDTQYLGVDDPSTTVDERTKTTFVKATQADLTDLPVLVRYYNKDHNKPGRRRFYEAGVAIRRVHSIHSFGETTADDGTVTCCDETAAVPSKTWLTGFVAGVGYQFIDEFKIRFVPELRYTHWMGRTFDTLSARSQTDQLELTVSITF